MPLTNTTLTKLKAKHQLYTVSDFGGLSIHVSPKGTKIWYFRFSWEGKQLGISLGKYPFISLKEAREKRNEMHRLLANNIDPRIKSIKTLSEANRITFKQFIVHWKELKYKKLGFSDPHRRNSTQVQIERYLSKDLLPALGHIPLIQITRKDISNVLKSMEARGAFCPAEKCRYWLREIFQYALIEGHIDTNPALDMNVIALPKPPVIHYPYLTKEELPQLLIALQNYSGTLQIKLALKLLLLTGVRPGELRFAKPEHFNIEQALWRIPATEIKQRKNKVRNGINMPDHLVPLSTQAITIIKELLSMCCSNQSYLLLGRSDLNKPISENTLNQGLQRLGYKDKLTPHGIRGTISTALYEMNYKEAWIETQLSHIELNKAKRAYNHAQYLKSRRRMMQNWADKLDEWKKKK